MLGNIEKVTEVFVSIAQGREIKSFEDWDQLKKVLRAYKLIKGDDLRSIDDRMLIFPLTVENFLKMLSNIYSPEEFKNFEYNIEKFNGQINDCKTMMNFWCVESLSDEEIKCMLVAFGKVLKEFKDIIKDFDAITKDINELKEDVEQVRDDLIHDFKEKTSFDYQKEESFSIEREYFDIRVRDAHYRNQPIKIFKQEDNGVTYQLGYCVDKDFPIEVIKVPKIFEDFSELETYLFTFDAYKELIFSKYLSKYYGFNSVSDSEFNLYFLELQKGKSLQNMIAHSRFTLSPKSLLFKHWVKEIYYGLKDLLYKCTYTLAHKITLKNIFVTDNGTKLYFKSLKFKNKRNNINESHEKTEILFLKTFSKLIQDLLESENLAEVSKKFVNVDLDAFLNSLEYADLDFQKNLEGKNPKRITFESLSNNPVINDDELKNSDVLELVEEYEKIFG